MIQSVTPVNATVTQTMGTENNLRSNPMTATVTQTTGTENNLRYTPVMPLMTPVSPPVTQIKQTLLESADHAGKSDFSHSNLSISTPVIQTTLKKELKQSQLASEKVSSTPKAVPQIKREPRRTKRAWKPTDKMLDTQHTAEELTCSTANAKRVKRSTKETISKKCSKRIDVQAQIKGLKEKSKKKNQNKMPYCHVCFEMYISSLDNVHSPKGIWMGCNMKGCTTWVHVSCLGWNEKDIDEKRQFICSVCERAEELL